MLHVLRWKFILTQATELDVHVLYWGVLLDHCLGPDVSATNHREGRAEWLLLLTVRQLVVPLHVLLDRRIQHPDLLRVAEHHRLGLLLRLIVVLGRGQWRWLLGFWRLVDSIIVEARCTVLRLEHFLRRLLGVDLGLVVKLTLIAQKVQCIVSIGWLGKLTMRRWNVWRYHKVVLTDQIIALLSMGHTVVEFTILAVNLELALVKPRIRQGRLSTLPILIHFVSTVDVLAVWA